MWFFEEILNWILAPNHETRNGGIKQNNFYYISYNLEQILKRVPHTEKRRKISQEMRLQSFHPVFASTRTQKMSDLQ